MKIAVYTLTRDRLEYTQRACESLRAKAGLRFDHFVVDNGSQDGTADWLKERYRPHWLNALPENVGISRGSNLALEAILSSDYGLIVKMDNDCSVVSENILGQMAEIFSDLRQFSPGFVLSPAVLGIRHQPCRERYTMLAGRRIGLAGIVGGLFHCVPARIYRQYRYPTSLSLAKGQDDHFCNWVKGCGGEIGYVEGLQVEHMDGTHGQAAKYPAYFERKAREEKLAAVAH